MTPSSLASCSSVPCPWLCMVKRQVNGRSFDILPIWRTCVWIYYINVNWKEVSNISFVISIIIKRMLDSCIRFICIKPIHYRPLGILSFWHILQYITYITLHIIQNQCQPVLFLSSSNPTYLITLLKVTRVADAMIQQTLGPLVLWTFIDW